MSSISAPANGINSPNPHFSMWRKNSSIRFLQVSRNGPTFFTRNYGHNTTTKSIENSECNETSIYNHEIVIVDDNPFGTFTLEMILQTEGFQNLKIFNDPTAVLQYAKESSWPALIITDFQMPNLNGIELIQELDQIFPGIDGIIVTGAPEIARQCSGRFPVLEKGNSVKEELLRLVWNIIDNGSVIMYREAGPVSANDDPC